MGQSFAIEEKRHPELPKLMLATIGALKAIGGSATIYELDEKIVDREDISELEQSYMMPNGKDHKLNYYLSWARTYLRRGGALENSSRGVWSLTEKGEYLNSLLQTQGIYDQVQREERERSRQRRLARKARSAEANDEALDPLEAITEREPEDWRERLASALMAMQPDAFERLAQRLLREAGFVKVEVRGRSGDGGIDGVGVLRVNLVSFQVYFQCKRWKGSVGSKDIRDFRGAMQGRADKGLFITIGTFTPTSAIRPGFWRNCRFFAARNGGFLRF